MAELKHRWSAAELLATDFPELTFFVDRIIPAGLTLFWGNPKSGKSIAALQMAVAVACGGAVFGQLKCEKADVLYITYEDGGRRLKRRLRDMGAPSVDNLDIFTRWPNGAKGIAALEKYLQTENPGARLVIIDPWQAFAAGGTDSNDYMETASGLGALKDIADRHDIAIVVVHHSRKPANDYNDTGDFIDTALGSRGLTGKPDHLLMLARGQSAGDAVLKLRSKDADPVQLAMNFDAELGSWNVIGDAAEIAATRERQEVLDILADAEGPVKSGDIAKQLQKKPNTVTYLLKQLQKEGKAYSPGYGLWTATETPSTPTETTESTESSGGGRGKFQDFQDFQGGREPPKDDAGLRSTRSTPSPDEPDSKTGHKPDNKPDSDEKGDEIEIY